MMNKIKAKITKKTSLISEVEEKLNDQVKMEGVSSQFYLAAASWCEREGYENAANFLYGHSEEERMHMLKLIKYINASGGYALAPEIDGLKYEFEGLRAVFDEVLEHEINVTNSINNLVDFSFKVKDYATFQFLQWYVAEQREEEELARRVIEIFDIIGESGQGLWFIDKEISKLKDKAESGEIGAIDNE